MQLGISSYTLTWSIGVPGYDRTSMPLTAIGLLQQAHQSGIHLVQIADNIPLHLMNKEELYELKSTAELLGVTIEVGTRSTTPEHLLAYLEIARYLNSNLVRTLITTPDIEAAHMDILQVIPQFEAYGITLGIENHGLHTTKQLSSMFNMINHPLVGCCMDTVNSFSALDSPDQVIQNLVPYIVNLHIKDFDITRVDHQMGFVVLGTPAGYGKLSIESLLSTIRSHRKNPTCILELWTPYTNNIEETILLERLWYEQSLTYLQQLDFSH